MLPRQQEDTTIMISGDFYVVHTENKQNKVGVSDFSEGLVSE
jgi:hypothetical protein